ncbi:uncharacterized protein Osi20 [Hetaerina americana]|uniref:uncharacterized protein Osi20 n=1 Tax=Hetaerina americana TaxID=62018 RepID=UPI003A7F4C62
MNRLVCSVLLLAAAASAAVTVRETSNEIDHGTIRSSEDLLYQVVDTCLFGDGDEGAMTCIRKKVLAFLDGALERSSAAGTVKESARAVDRELDELIWDRAARVLSSHNYMVQLPETLFQKALITYHPSATESDLRMDFPAEDPAAVAGRSASENQARDILKKKLLLPLFLLLKLKMKALQPILTAIIGLKALKALFLSKVAILLVVGFLVVNLLKKGGMAMPMMMPMMPDAMASGAPYGPPAPEPTSSYGAPNTWEPSAPSPYSRVWDPQQLAYKGYYQQQLESQQAQQGSPSSSTL